jgi:hypothetical protein
VLMNAVVDALSELGIEHMDMPATPQRVWSAICAAQNGSQKRADDAERRAVAPGKAANAKKSARKSKPQSKVRRG